jgi:hypothetical protein
MISYVGSRGHRTAPDDVKLLRRSDRKRSSATYRTSRAAIYGGLPDGELTGFSVVARRRGRRRRSNGTDCWAPANTPPRIGDLLPA